MRTKYIERNHHSENSVNKYSYWLNFKRNLNYLNVVTLLETENVNYLPSGMLIKPPENVI